MATLRAACRRAGLQLVWPSAIALTALLVAAGCSPESSVSEISCDSDEECPTGAECDGGYCVVFDNQDADLSVEVVGLPDGVGAEITVDGPEDYQATVSESETLEELWGGTYSITVDQVVDNGEIYAGAESEQSLDIDPGASAETTIDYDVISGSVEVSTVGLPEGATPGIELSDGDGDVIDTIEGAGVFEDVEPGEYSVDGEEYTEDAATYVTSSESVSVDSQETAEVELDYIRDPGSVTVDVQGLPEGADFDLELVDADGNGTEVPQDGVVEALEPGTYVLEVGDVDAGLATFEAEDIEDVIVESNETTELEVAYQAIPGVVDVDVQGLPEDVQEPQIEIFDADDEVAYTLNGADTLDVTPGEYTVVGDDVTQQLATYTAATDDIEVQSNETTEVSLEYMTVPGEVDVQVTGLPEGVDHELELVGDQNYTVPQDGMVSDVEPGSYTLEASPVEDGLSAFEAADVSVDVESDETTDVDVEYELIGADLEIAVTGLPDGLNGEVSVQGGDIDETVTAPIQYTDIEPGEYTITPLDVDDDPATYAAAEQSLSLESGDDELVTIDYEVLLGNLGFFINGLDDGLESNITVEGPDGYSEDVMTTEDSVELQDLHPGSYEIIVGDVDDEPRRFSGDNVSAIVESDDTTFEQVHYDVVLGELELEASGLPDEHEMMADVTGPGFSDTVTGEQVIEELEPGDYTVDFLDSEIDGVIYEPDPDEVTVEVSSQGLADTASASTQYELVPGELTVTSTGLPDNLELSATIEGPGDFSESIDDTTTFDDLEPGDYEVTFDDRQGSQSGINETYTMEDSTQTATVVSDAESTVTGEYEVVDGQVVIDVNVPTEDGAGEPLEPSFDIIDDDDNQVREFTITDSNQNEEFDLEPGFYDIEQDGSLEDSWGNTVEFEVEESAFIVQSNQTTNISISATLPTEVTIEDDDISIDGSLREVVDRVEDHSEITFADTVDTISLSQGVIDVDRPLSFIGDVTIEPENNDHRIFDIDFQADTDIVFQGLRLQHGDADGGGALRIDVHDVDITFFDVHFNDNTSDSDGGAVSIAHGADDSVTFSGAVFENNDAQMAGGAVYSMPDTNVDLTSESEFHHNGADEGGALYLSGDATVDTAYFYDNTAEDGGAIYVESGELAVEKALFEDNFADVNGGGIYSAATTDVENSTFSGNEVPPVSGGNLTPRGGAIYFEESAVSSLLHVTVVDNAAEEGAGIYSDNSPDIRLRSSYLNNPESAGDIEVDDSAISSEVPVVSNGYNYISEVSDEAFEESTEDITNEDSDFESLEENGGFTKTHAITGGQLGYRDIDESDCDDFSGNPVDNDQRGEDRPFEGQCTRGAWEEDDATATVN